ncbi:MAG: sulfite exporter TauE/SafE family protein [Deltaproteobacteria bacterium]|nr:sulfite exporter TauE/SafE family protein [Deltaproteobacteria bacterium]
MTVALFIALGLAAGLLSGLVGVGGGIIVVPALVLFFGFTQHQAQGTTLAMMVPPIGILAAWAYYTQGHVDIKAAGLLCAGFVIGGYLGGRAAVSLSTPVLTKAFGAFLLLVSLKMLFSK